MQLVQFIDLVRLCPEDVNGWVGSIHTGEAFPQVLNDLPLTALKIITKTLKPNQ